VLTTLNREYNSLFENLVIGKFRHEDHRVVWTRAAFDSANHVSEPPLLRSHAYVDLPSRWVLISTFLGSITVTSHSPAKNEVILTLLIGVVHLT